MPAEVGLPRNHSAAPGKAARVVIIGIQDDAVWLAVMTRPWAVSGSALMISMLTRAPALTVMAGLTSPAVRKVSSGPPAGLARTTSRTLLPVKVIRFAARSTVASAGIRLPSLAAWPGLTLGPGPLAHSAPMTCPGSDR